MNNCTTFLVLRILAYFNSVFIFLRKMLCLFYSFISSAPSIAPEFAKAISYGKSTMYIYWARIPDRSFNGKPLGYNITYYPVGSEHNLRFAAVGDTESTSFELSGLDFNTTYVIKLSALSSGGEGPAISTTATTGKVIPLETWRPFPGTSHLNIAFQCWCSSTTFGTRIAWARRGH